LLPKATTQFHPTVDTDIMSDAIVCISKEKADSLFRNGTNPEVTIAYTSGPHLVDAVLPTTMNSIPDLRPVQHK
jgi:hypothetical protein